MKKVLLLTGLICYISSADCMLHGPSRDNQDMQTQSTTTTINDLVSGSANTMGHGLEEVMQTTHDTILKQISEILMANFTSMASRSGEFLTTHINEASENVKQYDAFHESVKQKMQKEIETLQTEKKFQSEMIKNLRQQVDIQTGKVKEAMEANLPLSCQLLEIKVQMDRINKENIALKEKNAELTKQLASTEVMFSHEKEESSHSPVNEKESSELFSTSDSFLSSRGVSSMQFSSLAISSEN